MSLKNNLLYLVISISGYLYIAHVFFRSFFFPYENLEFITGPASALLLIEFFNIHANIVFLSNSSNNSPAKKYKYVFIGIYTFLHLVFSLMFRLPGLFTYATISLISKFFMTSAIKKNVAYSQTIVFILSIFISLLLIPFIEEIKVDSLELAVYSKVFMAPVICGMIYFSYLLISEIYFYIKNK